MTGGDSPCSIHVLDVSQHAFDVSPVGAAAGAAASGAAESRQPEAGVQMRPCVSRSDGGPIDGSEQDDSTSSESRLPEDLTTGTAVTVTVVNPVICECECSMGVAELVLKGEDQHDVREVEVEGEPLKLAMVADGHGGKAASLYLKRSLIDLFLAALHELGPPSGANLQRAGRRTFLYAHAEMVRNRSTTAGSTLSLVVVNTRRAEATAMHVGDSVARLVPRRSATRSLCEDHRIDSSEAEQQRLRAAGGKLARAKDKLGRPAGPLRLWPGGVAQARAIGDRDVGNYIDPSPTATTVTLPVEEGCDVIIGSDGVWDALKHTMVDGLARGGAIGPEATAQLIVSSSLSQRHAYSSHGDQVPRDDTTCVVMRIRRLRPSAEAGGSCCALM